MNVCDYTFPERFADKAQDMDKVDDTGGKYIMPTEEINVTTADDVDKFDDIDSKYNMPDVDKDTVEEIVQESDGKYIIHQKDTDKVKIIMGGLIDEPTCWLWVPYVCVLCWEFVCKGIPPWTVSRGGPW